MAGMSDNAMLFTSEVRGLPSKRHPDDFVVRTNAAQSDATVYEAVIAQQDMGVDLKRMDVESRFAQNPVILWSHDGWEPPIARSLEVRREFETGAWVSKFQFAEGDARADRIRNLWDQDVLRAMSIGFNMVKDSEGRQVPLLCEHSVVAVGLDEKALKRSYAGITIDAINDAYILNASKRMEESMTDKETSEHESQDEVPEDTPPEDAPAEDADDVEERIAKEVDARASAIAKQVQVRAEERADLIVRTASLMPSSFDTRGKNEHEILVAAVGDEVENAGERTSEYLLGRVDAILERRANAAKALANPKTATNTPKDLRALKRMAKRGS